LLEVKNVSVKYDTATILDEANLKALVYSGAVPSFSQMLEILNSRFSK
jgi:hypothetical protein